MNDHVLEKLSQIKAHPGIYRMIDKNGFVLYIGKSKNLRSRVRSYFRPQIDSEKIQEMVSLIADIKLVYTCNHLEARLLEIKGIKSKKPIYNRQFNRTPALAYLILDDKGIHLQEEGEFGPFINNANFKSRLDRLENLYPIRFKDGHYCFDYHVIANRLNELEWHETRLVLEGIFQEEDKMALFINALEEKMYQQSKQLLFEQASYYRDVIGLMEHLNHRLFVLNPLYKKQLIYKEPGPELTFYYLIYGGQILSKSESLDDLLAYLDQPAPALLKINEANYEEVNLIYSHLRYAGDGEIVDIG